MNTILPTLKIILRSFFLAACLVLITQPGMAADFTWNGGGANNNWGNTGNWVGGVAPSAGDAMIFTGTNRTSPNNQYSAGRNVGGITFDTTSEATSFTLTGNQINLQSSISTVGTNSGNHTIALDMVLTGSRVVTVVPDQTITISGTISESGGSRGLTKGSSGSLFLTGTNSFTGALALQGGATTINSLANAGINSAAGAGSKIQLGVNALSGTLIYTGSAVSTDRAVQVGSGNLAAHTGGGTIQNDGTGEITFTAANFNELDATAIANRVLTFTGSGNMTVEGIVANNASSANVGLAKSGTNTVTLKGNNTYDGTTSVTAGSLLINGNQSTATGAVSVSTNAILGGNGTIGGDVTVNDGGILAPGGAVGSVGTLTLNTTDLTIGGADAKLALQITGTGAGNFDRIVGIDAFARDGDITFTLTGSYSFGDSWDVFDFASGSGNFDTVTLAGSYSGALSRTGDIWSNVNIGGNEWSFDQSTGVLSVVPEPGTWVLVAIGLAVTAFFRWARRSGLGSGEV